jgi:hypothetical protein
LNPCAGQGSPLTERAVNYIVKDAAERAGVNPAASVHWRCGTPTRATLSTTAPRNAGIGDARPRRPENHQVDRLIADGGEVKMRLTSLENRITSLDAAVSGLKQAGVRRSASGGRGDEPVGYDRSTALVSSW